MCLGWNFHPNIPHSLGIWMPGAGVKLPPKHFSRLLQPHLVSLSSGPSSPPVAPASQSLWKDFPDFSSRSTLTITGSQNAKFSSYMPCNLPLLYISHDTNLSVEAQTVFVPVSGSLKSIETKSEHLAPRVDSLQK